MKTNMIVYTYDTYIKKATYFFCLSQVISGMAGPTLKGLSLVGSW